MKLTLFIAATLASFTHGARYGLLRVGSPSDATAPDVAAHFNERSLFDEDFSLAFRQLFGYSAGLSLSMMPGAQLSMSLAPLSLSPVTGMSLGAGMSFAAGMSLAPGMSFAGLGVGISEYGTVPSSGTVTTPLGGSSTVTTKGAEATTGQAQAASEENNSAGSSTPKSSGLGAATVATVSAVAVLAVAAVGAVVYSKSRTAASSSASAGSASVGSPPAGNII